MLLDLALSIEMQISAMAKSASRPPSLADCTVAALPGQKIPDHTAMLSM